MSGLRKAVLDWSGRYGLWVLGFLYALWIFLLGVVVGGMLGVSALLGLGG